MLHDSFRRKVIASYLLLAVFAAMMIFTRLHYIRTHCLPVNARLYFLYSVAGHATPDSVLATTNQVPAQ